MSTLFEKIRKKDPYTISGIEILNRHLNLMTLIHAPLISSCLKNKCRQLGISERGIHAFRKTFNSKLRCNGVSSIEAASLLGHSKEVNENYYTFDVSSLKEKADMVSKVIKKA